MNGKVTQDAFDLIKQFEGFRSQAYPDPATGGAPWTIGYGTTAAAGVGITPRRGMVISQDEAEVFLWRAVQGIASALPSMLTREATDDQFGAIVSFCYNVGLVNFANSSVRRRFNAGDFHGAADAFLLWNKAGGKVMPGLTRRRRAERAMFLRGTK